MLRFTEKAVTKLKEDEKKRKWVGSTSGPVSYPSDRLLGLTIDGKEKLLCTGRKQDKATQNEASNAAVSKWDLM